jgi:predicted aconitase
MRLTAEEEAMLRGAEGEAVARALRMQIEVGEFFGAAALVPVASAQLATGDRVRLRPAEGLCEVVATAAG